MACLLMASIPAFSQNPSLATFTVEYKDAEGKDKTIQVSSVNANSFSFIGGEGEVMNTETWQRQKEENRDLYIWTENIGTYSATVKPMFGTNLYFYKFGYCIAKHSHPEVSDNLLTKSTFDRYGYSYYHTYYKISPATVDVGELEEDKDYVISGVYDPSTLLYLNLSNLEYMTTYYVRPYVEFSGGYIMYGGEKSFTTPQTMEGALRHDEDLAEGNYYDAQTGVTLTKEALSAMAGYSGEVDASTIEGIKQDLEVFLYSDIIAYPAYPTLDRPQEPRMPMAPYIVDDPGELLEYEAWCEMEGRPDNVTSRRYYDRYIDEYEANKSAYEEWLITYPQEYASYQKDSTEYADVTYPAYLQELAEYEQTWEKMLAEYNTTCQSIDGQNKSNYDNGVSILGKLKYSAYRSIECTDGTLYVVKDVPADVAEAFQKYFYGGISFSPWGNVNMDEESWSSKGFYEMERVVCDESWGVPNNEYVDFRLYGNNNPTIGINIPKYLHGTYEMTITVVNPKPEEDSRGYHFQTSIYEKNPETWLYKNAPVRLTPPEGVESDGNYYVTDGTKRVETISLGEYTFNGMPNTIIQFYNYVSASRQTIYNREMKISQISLVPIENK